jgi:hypothetical protein
VQVLERWGFVRVLALTVEKIEGKEHKQCLALWMAERRASKSDRNWTQRPARAPFSNSKSLARLSNDGPQSASYMA